MAQLPKLSSTTRNSPCVGWVHRCPNKKRKKRVAAPRKHVLGVKHALTVKVHINKHMLRV